MVVADVVLAAAAAATYLFVQEVDDHHERLSQFIAVNACIYIVYSHTYVYSKWGLGTVRTDLCVTRRGGVQFGFMTTSHICVLDYYIIT